MFAITAITNLFRNDPRPLNPEKEDPELVAPILGLPDDLIPFVLPNQNGILRLAQTSKNYEQAAKKFLSGKKITYFIDTFGALAEHEKSISLNSRGMLHHRTRELATEYSNSKTEQNTRFHITFDAEGLPTLDRISEKKEVSWWDDISSRYHTFRGDYEPNTAQRLVQIFAEHAKIFRNFDKTTPFTIDATQNCDGWSDLADKVTRLHTIEKEQEVYKEIIERYRDSIKFNTLEKIIYSVASFVHSIFVTSCYDLIKPSFFSQFSQTPSSPSKTPLELFRKNRTVLLGERTIDFEGGKLNVKLEVKNKYFSSDCVVVTKADDGTFLGDISLDLESPFQEGMKRNDDPFKMKKHISASLNFVRSDGNDRQPIVELLTQAAVEVLLRQSCQLLKMNSKHNETAYYSVTGFSGRKFQKIKKTVLEGREKGELYPDRNRDYGGRYAFLKKSKTLSTLPSTGSQTLLRNAEFESGTVKKGPAIVHDAKMTDNGIKCSEKTWEESIRENGPILSNGKRSVLPRIYR